MSETNAAAAGFGMLPPEFRTHPYPIYEQLRSVDPVLFMPGIFGKGAWLITGHAECAAVLRDSRFGKDPARGMSPEEMALLPGSQTDFVERRRANMLFADPPDHTRLRSLVNQAFSPRQLERLRPHIAEIAAQLLDQLAARSSADLIAEFAFPLPIVVIAELLGVPPQMRDQFKAWSGDLILGVDPSVSPEQMEQVRAAVRQLDEYFAGLVEERRRAPKEDLISGLIAVHDQGDKLSIQELLTTCRLLLAAGHETTVNLIGNGALALLRHPEQGALLAADPQLAQNAIEELLRYDSPVQLTMRIAFDDLPVGKHTLKKGDVVFTLLGAANRDPLQYADPARLDLRRTNAGTHLSFAMGIHYCLGAPLARMEGQIAIPALLRRFPNLTLTEAELHYRGNLTLRGLQALPVTL